MGAALYFCSVFDGREKSTEMFCNFFLCAARVFCCVVLFLKGGVVPYVAGSQTGLSPTPQLLNLPLTVLNFESKYENLHNAMFTRLAD